MKKVVIGIICLIVVALICVGIYFGSNSLRVNKYSNIDTYDLKDEKIPSVAKVVGEGTLKKVSLSKGEVDTLTLTFEDPNAKASTEKYLAYLKEEGNYIDLDTNDANKKQIGESSKQNTDLVTIETELTEKGYILTIQVGQGQIKLNPQE